MFKDARFAELHEGPKTHVVCIPGQVNQTCSTLRGCKLPYAVHMIRTKAEQRHMLLDATGSVEGSSQSLLSLAAIEKCEAKDTIACTKDCACSCMEAGKA